MWLLVRSTRCSARTGSQPKRVERQKWHYFLYTGSTQKTASQKWRPSRNLSRRLNTLRSLNSCFVDPYTNSCQVFKSFAEDFRLIIRLRLRTKGISRLPAAYLPTLANPQVSVALMTLLQVTSRLCS
jgi:hypothetical protein